ncbi:hypothetical protein JCM19037_4377 [Geomicrobium sp. JCM 19037]|uniref:hypothetical protein n=1 Tax=unclassified Geomicrobium TaxID=2628951 RepID=UPI00045F3B03|nr:hypothetical protein [Geomicrobium sp. JCM 19037]GAK05845.1 hypothetical protein JCM19037_4377 [Geomicrobium sp. JCM 19037]
MGLDMYLVVEKRNDFDGVYHEEIAYWRKANHIHRWFVENVQNEQDDCKMYPVSREQLEHLLHVCSETLNDPSTSHYTLPALAGPFFGETSYDEWYYQDVSYTAQVCKTILALFNFKSDARLLYYSWW